MTTLTPLRIGSVVLPGRAVGTRKYAEELGVWSYLVRSSDITALVDVGLPPKMDVIDAHVLEDLGSEFGYEGAGREQLERALGEHSVHLSDIDVVILTHLHHDHSGGVVWLSGPEVWCHSDEQQLLTGAYQGWLGPEWQITNEIRARFESMSDAHRVRWWLGPSIRLNSDISIHWVGGHTPGSSAVLVETEDEVVAVVGDLLLTEEELVEARIPSFAVDLRETVDGVRAIANIAQSLWTGHAHDGPVPASVARSSWTDRAEIEIADVPANDAGETPSANPQVID